MAFNKPVPTWNAEGVEPPASLKNAGFEAGYKPPADYFNWFWHTTGEAIDELQEKAFVLGGVYTGDMNELVLAGQYRVQSNTNLPNDTYYGQVFVGRSVSEGGNNDTVSQLVIGYTGNAPMYYRGGQLKNGAWTWTAWGKVYSNLNLPSFNSVSFLGTNPVTTPAEDTTTKWNSLGSGFARYSALDQLNAQPSRYGFLVSYTYGSDVFQLWHTLPSGAVYTRSGSDSGWTRPWTKLYDTANKPTPNDVVSAALSGQTAIPNGVDLNTYKTVGNYHCTGDYNATTLTNCPTVHAFRMMVGYPTGLTSYIYQEIIDWVTGTRYYRQCLASTGVWSNWIKSYDTSEEIESSDFVCLGQNPIASPTEDTVETWDGLGSGYAWITGSGHLTDQPTTYGFVVSFKYGSDIFQIWKSQATGAMYLRSGDASGWGHTWAKVYDSLNKPTPAAIGALALTGGDLSGDTTMKHSSNPAYRIHNTYFGRRVAFQAANDGTVRITNSAGDENYYSEIVLDQETSDLSTIIKLKNVLNGVASFYNLYGEHNKPSAAEIGAATLTHKHSPADITSGGVLGAAVQANATTVQYLTTKQVRNIYANTTDLTAGSSSLTTGDIYLVYE